MKRILCFHRQIRSISIWQYNHRRKLLVAVPKQNLGNLVRIAEHFWSAFFYNFWHAKQRSKKHIQIEKIGEGLYKFWPKLT